MIRCHVLNTRPQHQSKNLTHLIKKKDGNVFYLPLFEILPVKFKPIKIGDFSYIIFLSANAVNYFFHKNKKNIGNAIIIAIGSATQAALKKHEIEATCPVHFSSEGILQINSLKKIDKKSIAIISGKNSKSLLQEKLIERGAIINNIICYERKAIKYDMELILAQLKVHDIDVIICTSGESLACLLQLFSHQKHRAWLIKKAICVINNEMTLTAQSHGFQTVLEAENATDEKIVEKIFRS